MQWLFVALAAIILLLGCGDDKPNPQASEENAGNNEYNSDPNAPDIAITEDPIVEDTTQVSNVSQLPKCTAENEGDAFMVSSEDALYFCVNGVWDKNAIESMGVSCEDGILKLGISQNPALQSSFGKDSTGAIIYRRNGIALAGVAEKGPFQYGTSVTIIELDSMQRLADSDRIHKNCITTSNGSYRFDALDVVSPYVRAEAKGFFKNELTGGLSSEQITLVTVTDLTDRDSININMLTHLEAPRTLKLVENTGNNQPIRLFKEQAFKDVLNSFGIQINGYNVIADDINLFGDGEYSAALIAISVMMQRYGSGKNMLDFASTITEKIRGNGNWDDWDARAKLADWLMVLDTSNAYQTIRNNLEKLNQGIVENFEKYLRNFWTSEYRFPICGAQNAGSVIHVNHSQSSFFACNFTDPNAPKVRFTCDANLGRWRTATDIEKDTVGLGADTSKYNGAIRPGVINKDKHYVYEASKNQWRLATSDDIMEFTAVEDVYEKLGSDESVVFVLRHAERTSETGSKGHLTDVGKSQAKNVGEKFKKEASFFFGYSGYTRTKETCENIGLGAGQSSVTPEILDGLDGDWYLKDRDKASIEELSMWAYRGIPSNGFYNLEERSNEFVSKYITAKRSELKRVNFYISHDMMVLPLTVFASQGKVDLRYFDTQGSRNWLNFLAGVAVIYNSAGKVRYVPVRGLESGTMKL